MSHTNKVKELKLVDKATLQLACTQLGYNLQLDTRTKLFDRVMDGHAIKLPDWRYPVVIDVHGAAHYDSYNGQWGDEKFLDTLCETYSRVATERQMAEIGAQFRSTTTNEFGEVELVYELPEYVG